MKKFFLITFLSILAFFLFKKDKTNETYHFIKKGMLMYKTLYDEIYKYYAELRKMDWHLLKAIAFVESSENPEAIGDDDKSFGLMQVQSLIGSYYIGSGEKETLLQPSSNVNAGSAFLADLLIKYDLEDAIQAYNMGETKFKKGYRAPIYLKNVLNHYYKIKEIYV